MVSPDVHAPPAEELAVSGEAVQYRVEIAQEDDDVSLGNVFGWSKYGLPDSLLYLLGVPFSACSPSATGGNSETRTEARIAGLEYHYCL